jgi:hypothetical protein
MSTPIDVIDKIKPLLKFDTPDDFYYLQLLQRKKENPQLGANSRVIRNYYIRSWEYLDGRYEEVKELCHAMNARAMLRLNKRSFRKVGLKAIQNVANCMANEDYASISKCYDRACGQGHSDNRRMWILDIDGEVTSEWKRGVIAHINRMRPEGSKVILELPTRNGTHIIVSPFDMQTFSQDFPDVDVHKDNPINLYTP